MAWEETVKRLYSQQPENPINSTRLFFGFLSLADTRKPGTSTTVIRSMQNSTAQVSLFLQQLRAQAIRNCKEDFHPVQSQCSHTSTLCNRVTSLNPKNTSRIHYPFCSSSFLPSILQMGQDFLFLYDCSDCSWFTAEPKTFVACPKPSLFSRFFYSPNTLDRFSLALTIVEHHADRSIHRHVNKEVYIPGYTE